MMVDEFPLLLFYDSSAAKSSSVFIKQHLLCLLTSIGRVLNTYINYYMNTDVNYDIFRIFYFTLPSRKSNQKRSTSLQQFL